MIKNKEYDLKEELSLLNKISFTSVAQERNANFVTSLNIFITYRTYIIGYYINFMLLQLMRQINYNNSDIFSSSFAVGLRELMGVVKVVAFTMCVVLCSV